MLVAARQVRYSGREGDHGTHIMNRRNSTVLASLGAACAVAWLGGVPPSAGQEKMKTVRAHVSGKLQGMQGDLLQVLGETGERWVVKLPRDKRNVVYENQADASVLQPGMLVQFSARLDKKGKARSEVEKLKVFTARDKNTEFGVIAEATGGAAGNLFSDSAENEGKKKKRTPAPEAQPFLITGQLTGIKKNKLQVAAGAARIEVELLDGAEISLELADLSLVRPGDLVTADGRAYAQKKSDVVADRVAIAGAAKVSLDPKAAKKRHAAKE